MMFEMYLPIPHLWIIYGAIALVIEMLIGFIVEISRGLLALSNLSRYLPIKGPTRNWGSGGAFIAALITAFLYPFYGAPMTSCHTQSLYLSKPKTKALAHALVWWGFVFTAISTTLGFIFDEWVSDTAFIPGGRLGPMGPYAVIGTGALGGILIIVGFILMMAVRWQGTRPVSEPAITDFFLWTAFFVVLSGFAIMGVELTAPTNYWAVSTAFSVHIFLVAMMFATMPWTKFGHAIYMYIWQLYDRYRTWKGVAPRLLGPWSGELAKQALHSHHPSHRE
jgi:nitrate reductase gamma subunit